jgi:hypothetical protein
VAARIERESRGTGGELDTVLQYPRCYSIRGYCSLPTWIVAAGAARERGLAGGLAMAEQEGWDFLLNS